MAILHGKLELLCDKRKFVMAKYIGNKGCYVINRNLEIHFRKEENNGGQRFLLFKKKKKNGVSLNF